MFQGNKPSVKGPDGPLDARALLSCIHYNNLVFLFSQWIEAKWSHIQDILTTFAKMGCARVKALKSAAALSQNLVTSLNAFQDVHQLSF